MVSGPVLPERPAVVPGGAQGFVPDSGRRAILFPRAPVLADGDDRRDLAVDPSRACKHALPGSGWRAPAAGVIGAVRGHGADLFALGDLVPQLRQNRAVAVAAGSELYRPDVRSGGVHGQMDLAPPLTVCKQTAAWHGMFTCPRGGQRSAQGRIVRHGPVQVRHLEQAGNHPCRLPQWQFEQDLDRQACVDTPACASDFVISMIK